MKIDKIIRALSILILLILFLSGCAVEIPKLPEVKIPVRTSGTDTTAASEKQGSVFADNPVLPPPDGAKEITVKCRYPAEAAKIAAEHFEEKTGIKVNVLDEYNIYNDFNAMEQKYATELMAGKGPDIYMMLSYYDSYGAQGLLVDVLPWLIQDPELNDENFYTSFVRGMQSNDAIYAVPLSFVYVTLRLHPGAIVPSKTKYTWAEFFEMTKDLPRSGVVVNEFDTTIFRFIFSDNFSKYVDLEAKTHHLDSPEMRTLLEQIYQWRDKGYINSSIVGPGQTDFEPLYETYSSNSVLSLCKTMPDVPNVTQVIPIPIENDETIPSTNWEWYSINAASPYKRTAYEFIKFMLTDEEAQHRVTGFPLKKSVLEEKARSQMEEMSARGADIDVARLTEQVLDRAALLKPPLLTTGIVEDINEIVYEYCDSFFKGEISMDSAVKQMSDKVGLLFKEMD